MALPGKENKKMYISILFGFIASISITLLISSAILHVNFEEIALQQVYRSDLDSLMAKSREVSNMTEIAKSLTYQIYSDSSLTPLQLDPNPNIYEVLLAMRQLNNYRMSLPFIESIYIYNARTDTYYISSSTIQNGSLKSEELDDQQIAQMLSDIHAYAPYTPIPRTYSVGTDEQDAFHCYTYLSYNTLNKTLDYAVIINIMASWINQEPTELGHKPEVQTFIIDKQGLLYSNHKDAAMLTDYSDLDIVQKILADTSSPGYFEYSADGVRSLVTYTQPDALGWLYVRITPYDLITSEIREMRLNTVYLSSAILLLGFIISLLISHKLYKPIHTVLHRVHALESERRNHVEILRQSILRNFLSGREKYTSQMLQERLASVGCAIEISEPFTLVLLKIDDFKKTRARYGDDLRLMKYAIMNICSEIAAAAYRAEAVNLEEDSMILIINMDQSDENMEWLPSMLKHMQHAVMKHLDISISLTVSPTVSTLEHAGMIYKQVNEASMHRLFHGAGSILYSDEIMRLRSKEYEFPVHKEKQLIEMLMMGRAEEAKVLCSEIIRETADYPYSVVQLAVSHLTMTIGNALNTIKKNHAISTNKDLDFTFLSLLDAGSIEEIQAQFNDLFDEIISRLDQKRSSKHEDLIHKIHELIEREYHDHRLSLNMIADELGMSPVYISRLYKQLTMKGLTDQIAEVRMMKAKELLDGADLSIAEIAQRIGFTNSSYFHRVFKRYNGMTPNDYRRAKLAR